MGRKRVASVSGWIVVCGLAGAVAAREPMRPRIDLDPPARPPAAATAAPVLPQDLESRARARYVTPDLLEAAIVPEDYVLGPGDLLAFVLVVGDTRTESLPVLPEGVVVIPNVGPVPAAGRTLSAFRDALRQAVAKRYRDFELYCYLARPRQFRVWVTGEVREPGSVAARAVERVSDAVERAGGLTDRASRREIEVCDTAGTVLAQVDLDAFLLRGDASGNPRLGDGQLVRVPPRRRTVELAGEVAAPGTFEPRRGESLADLLALAGGLTPTGDPTRVTVESVDSTGALHTSTYDLGRDTPLAGDATRVTVLSTRLGRPRVFVTGPNGVTEMFYLERDETLADLARRVAVGPNADLRAAELATRDDKGQAEVVSVDLVRVLAGESDRPLHDGDVLALPSVKDYVYVSGHVTRPGRFGYRADWTVNDYVGEAGGPTAAGSRDRAVLLAPDGSKRDGDRTTPVRPGETVFLDRSVTGKVSGALGLLANLSALIISVVALNR